MLARHGLRAGEVVGLNLDDIDWSTGQITIRGKGGKSAQLPLAADVGTALAPADRPTLAGGELVIKAIESYLALRRAAGFSLSNTEYLLRSFARFAGDRQERYIRTPTAIEWANEGPSIAQ